jgi:uncharacterized damage-inducible protein DinB
MPTHRDELDRLYNYHYWAMRQLLPVVAKLTPEEFSRSVAGSYGSVQETLVHTLSAEWGWLERCGGWARGEKLRSESYPTPASLIDQWSKVEAKMREFLRGLTDKDLDEVVEFTMGRPWRLERGQLLRHGAIHGVHHRGQVALLLRALGHVPGNFDYLFYAEAVEGSSYQISNK